MAAWFCVRRGFLDYAWWATHCYCLGYCLIYFACANFRSNTPVHEPYSLVIKTAGQSIARQALFRVDHGRYHHTVFSNLIPIDSGYQGDIFTESRAIAPYLCRPGTAGQWSIKGHHITGARVTASQVNETSRVSAFPAIIMRIKLMRPHSHRSQPGQSHLNPEGRGDRVHVARGGLARAPCCRKPVGSPGSFMAWHFMTFH